MRLDTSKPILWSEPDRIAARQFRAGFWSTDDPSHIVFHAVGRDNWDGTAAQAPLASGVRLEDCIPGWLAARVLGQVGRHALSGGAREFVAEVLAGLLAGREYDSHIFGLYGACGGQGV